MKKIFILFLFWNSIVACVLGQSIEPEWIRYQENTHSLGENYPFSIADKEGNVIICGTSYDPGLGIGMVTTKYSADGTWLWEARYETISIDLVTSAVTDDSGHVYVAVNSINPTTYKLQFVVFKYDGNTGDLIWEYRYHSGAAGETSNVNKLLMLPSQRLVMACRIFSDQIGGTQATVIALDVDANPVWEYQRSMESGTSSAFGAVVDRSGDIVVWGWGTSQIAGEPGLLCVRLDQDGIPLSDEVSLPYTDDFRYNFHIDIEGNLYIGDFAGEYKVTKYNVNGIQEWQYAKPFVPSPSLGYSRLYAICTDTSGNVYAGGTYYPDSVSGRNMYVTKLSPSGIPLWEHLLIVRDTNRAGNVYSAVYLSSGVIAIGGNIQLDVSNNSVYPFIAYYSPSGFQSGGICAMETPYNVLSTMSADSSFIYISGQSGSVWSPPYIERQFVSKIAIPQVSSTESTAWVQKIGVFPNPTTGAVQLSFGTTGAGGLSPAYAEVSSADGRITVLESISVHSGENSCPLQSMKRLPAGTYIVRLHVGREVFQGKVVKVGQ